jgi:hypothetical protein
MKADAANLGDADDDCHAVTLLKNLTHKSGNFWSVLEPPNAPSYLQLRGHTCNFAATASRQRE